MKLMKTLSPTAFLKDNKKQAEGLVCFLGILLLELLFFRQIIFNDRLFGDAADGLLNNLLTEHWFQVLLGKEKWSDLLIFYPAANTISYTDMALGFIFPYILFRFLGMNLFLANKISLICLHCFGSFCFGWLLYKKCRVSALWTLIGVTVFSYSGAYYSLLNHTQMFAISYIPFILLMLWNYFEKWESRKRIVYMLFAVTGIVLLFYTAFYVGYFFAVFCIVFVLTYLVYAAIGRRSKIKTAFGFMKKRILEMILYMLYAVVLLLPFLYAYLPTMQSMGDRDWDIILEGSPGFGNVIDLSSNTVLYGKALNLLGYKGNSTIEGDVNFSAITIILLLAVTIWYLKKSGKTDTWESFLIMTCLVASLVSVVLVIRIGDSSLWYLFYKIVPGASALRAMARYYLLLHLPIGFLIAYCGSRLCEGCSLKSIGITVLLLLLVLTGNMKSRISASWNISDELSYLQNVPDPPADCEIAYFTNDKGDIERFFPFIQMKAWEIANDKGIKTINGYSGNYPEDWGLEYLSSVNNLGRALCWISRLHAGEQRDFTDDIYDDGHIWIYDMVDRQWISLKDVELSYTTYTKELYLDGGEISKEAYILYPGGIQFGPYLSLPKGRYIISVWGENLQDVEYDCSVPSYDGASVKELTHSQDMIEYVIELEEETDGLEFRTYNFTEHDCRIYKLTIAPYKG